MYYDNQRERERRSRRDREREEAYRKDRKNRIGSTNIALNAEAAAVDTIAADSPVGAATETATDARSTDKAEFSKRIGSATALVGHKLPSEVPTLHAQKRNRRVRRSVRRQKNANRDSRYRHRHHRSSRESDEYARSTHDFEQGDDVLVRFARAESRDYRQREWERDRGKTPQRRDINDRHHAIKYGKGGLNDSGRGCSARRRMRRRSRSRSYDRRPSRAHY